MQVSSESQVEDQNPGAAGLDTLCRDCNAVNWPTVNVWNDIQGIEKDLLHGTGVKTRKIIRIFHNPVRSQLLKSSCGVCRFVAYLSNPTTNNRSQSKAQYRNIVPRAFILEADLCDQGGTSDNAKSSYLRLAVRSSASDRSLLQEDHDYVRFLLAHKHTDSEMLQIRMLHPSQICFDFFKSKMEMCYNDHEECRSTSTAPVGLRLIDVRTNKVCCGIPSYQYIALSYVWGNAYSQNPEEDFPPVVQDAMSVTKALGCQYLWVDRYVSYGQAGVSFTVTDSQNALVHRSKLLSQDINDTADGPRLWQCLCYYNCSIRKQLSRRFTWYERSAPPARKIEAR